MVIIVIIIGLVGWCRWGKEWNGTGDFRMAIAADDGVWMVSVSPERKMTNVVKIDTQVNLWIPGGLGWYKVEALKKIINQEKLADKWANIMFFNFGFVADKLVIIDRGERWNDWPILMKEMGVWGYMKYQWVARQMLVRNSSLNEKEVVSGELLDEMMPRDLADSGLLADDRGITVVNNTTASGLASFISKKLEWSGIGVNSNENGEKEVDGCEFRTKREISGVLEKVMKQLMGCKIVKSSGEELFLGESFSKMIKYSSYARTF
jgi:hypothetical protein